MVTNTRYRCSVRLTLLSTVCQVECKHLHLSIPTFGFDGFRWHARAYCIRDETFKDYVIARILNVNEEEAAEVDPETDQDWHSIVTLVIAPNPGLSQDRRKVIEFDYGMKQGQTSLEIRGAMAHCVKQRLDLDRDLKTVSPEEQQIILVKNKARRKERHVTPRGPCR